MNGGAFAVGRLFLDGKAVPGLGGLTLHRLSFGMIVFTIVMTLDIFMFGEKMRSAYSLRVSAKTRFQPFFSSVGASGSAIDWSRHSRMKLF